MKGSGLETFFATEDIGQGPGAITWLTGDFTGSGNTEIAQPWANGSSLGLNVYGYVQGTS